MYGSLLAKAAALMESLACNRAFFGGNKRVALVAAFAFLSLNDIRMRDPRAADGDTFMRSVAMGNETLDSIVSWLERHSK